MMTMGEDRMKTYEQSNIADMRKSIYTETDKITNILGFYPLQAKTTLLTEM